MGKLSCFNEVSEYILRGGIEDKSLLPWEQILFFGSGSFCPGGQTGGLRSCFTFVNGGVLMHL